MNQELFFENAKWLCAPDDMKGQIFVLRGKFFAKNAHAALLNVLGLGFFKCYINGVCVNPDTFLPLSSDYEDSCDPSEETLAGHRVYVPQFDITPYVKDGENVIAIHFGGGWYTHFVRTYGKPKAIYCISVVGDDGEEYFVSDENCRIAQSYIVDYNFTAWEVHNYGGYVCPFGADFDDSSWANAKETYLDTEYCTTDCPIDKLVREVEPKYVGQGERGAIYDCGINMTGYPVIEIDGEAGELVEIQLSEELLPNGNLDTIHMHHQRLSIFCGGEKRVVVPELIWYGFRYFEVIGKAKPITAKLIYADVKKTSHFECDNETLNWTYETFLHTMLCNMHTGHPSDCPHIERRGYTGDGQLTCHAVLSTLDAEAFYKKWMQDIADCQDIFSGHVQYTAPYIQSGGGPGGWGCAIIEVPYQLYRHYGDSDILKKYYHGMRRYIDYLDSHSEFGLVTSDKAGEWCLGDWCGPNILYPDRDITFHNQQVMIPAPMVNTYFAYKSLKTLEKIAKIIGRDEDIEEYQKKAEERKRAIRAAYFNTFDGNFVMNVQGANAYAVDVGIGDGRTYANMVDYYKKLGYFDTGIFATDILIRTLFERGDYNLAIDLLENNGTQGFEHWRRNGATTFHEYWDSNRSRSHSHPMFGAPVAYFFEYLLGIKQTSDSAGYEKLEIKPVGTERFGYMKGYMEIPSGRVSVSYKHEGGKISFEIDLPKGVSATLVYGGETYELSYGENTIEVKEE